MCEILRTQFEHELPKILEVIHRCDFIAIDTEFTGLKTGESDKPSLFDTPEDRYKKLKRTTTQFTVCQFGLSAFVKHPDHNKYEAYTYNFYLFPIACSTVDVLFSCQASSLEFLCRHNFDFNKFIYDGVLYLNEEQEKELRQQLKEQPALLTRYVDHFFLSRYVSAIADWTPLAEEDEELVLERGPGVDLAYTFVKLHAELRRQFTDIWTSTNEAGQIVVQKVSKEERQKLESSSECLEESLLNKTLGFSKVFRALVRAKKPIIGHNMLQDLCFIYHKLHRPLPATYREFKEELHRIFPSVFDTKHIAGELRKCLSENVLFGSSNLQELYLSLDSHRGRYFALYSPDITYAEKFNRYTQQGHPHEAGYDSFMAGYVFLRMGHLLAVNGLQIEEIKPQEFTNYLLAFSKYKNHVNMIRASLHSVNLAGPDPDSKRPEWLHVRIKDPKTKANSLQLAEIFGTYGSVDVRILDPKHAILAVATHRGAKDMLKAFHRHKAIRVAKYNTFQHSQGVRILLWSGLAVTVSVCIWTFVSS
ncbi:poly(A)-specific ribonuclease PNLDC1-like isoform X2 [Glandiceps talaboti]